MHWVATECSRNDGSKTQYYIVILDRLQGRSRALERAPESRIRGPLTEFTYNNKIHMATKILPFKANCGQDPRIGFKGRRKGKYEVAEKFVERMKGSKRK